MKKQLLLITILSFLCLNVNAQTQLITNGNFSSSSGWTTSGNWYITTTKTCYNNSSGYAYAGDANGYAVNNEIGDLKQTVTIPSTATSATLTFYASKSTDEVTTTEVFDYVNVFLLNSSGSQLMQFSPTNINNLYAGKPSTLCDGYSFKSFSIPTSYFGQPVQVVFRVHTDGAKYTMFRIDDVSLTYIGGCSTPSNPANPTSNSPQTGSVTITRAGSPPSGVTWYWQGTSCGTSMSLGSGSTFTATSSGTYYIRAYNNTGGCWSTNCGSVNVSVTATCTTPSTPGNPTSNSPQAGSVTITRAGSPPSGVTWYWQGTSCGTSMSLGSGSTYTAISSGTYYIRAYNNTGGCWSSSCGSVSVTISSNSSQINGVDINPGNKTVSWSQVYTTNHSFAYIKATEGKSYPPSVTYFNSAIISPNPYKVVLGAFHYARPDNGNTALDEANNFLSNAGSYIGNGYLPPSLDMDAAPVESYLSSSHTKAQLAQWVNDWCTQVYNVTSPHRWPVLYVDRCRANYLVTYYDNGTNNGTINSNIKLWIADYPETAGSPVGYEGCGLNWNTWPWVFHQYLAPSEAGNDPTEGADPGMDQDVFYGDQTAFNNLIGANSNLPDLQVTAGTQTATPSSVIAGNNITASCSEDNSGNALAGANDVTLWLSIDDVLNESNDNYLGKIAFPSIAAGSNSTILNTTVKIPSNTSSGNYYLFFWADGNKAIAESNDGNNFASVQITVSGGSYTIATSSNPTGGGTTSGGGTFNSGASVTVIATPSSNYSFVNWTENGSSVSTNAGYNFTVSSNRTLVANFQTNTNTFTITTSSSPSGGGTTGGGGTFNAGASVTVTATPSSNYSFVNWTENGSSVSTNVGYNFTVSSNRTLVANFQTNTNTFTITTSSSPSGGGTTSGGGTFNSGASVTVIATPASNYSFVNWTENGSSVSTNPSYNFTISANRTLVANFQTNTGTFTITTSSSPTNGGTTSGGGTFNSGTSVTVTATSASNYSFVNWKENGSPVSTNASYNFNVSANRTLVANFQGGCSHNWTLVTYTNNMTLYGIVTINGSPAAADDKVGAFVGTECRGIGDITISQGVAYTTMNIQGNTPENVSFRIWDASACSVLPALPIITSNPGGTMGYPTFIQISVSDNVAQTISLTSNWSLVSLYVKSAGRSPSAVFGNAACGNIEVKNMTQSYNSAVPDYQNTLKILIDGQGYFVKSTNTCNSTIQDQLIGNNYSIDLNSGWNLVGFPHVDPSGLPGAGQTLISAGKLVQIKNMVKSYRIGDPDFLNNLKCVYPGDGYFMNLSSSHNGFVWQQSTCQGEPKSGYTDNLCWNFTGYLQSMVVYGDVTLDGESLTGTGTIGAFVKGECRGVTSVLFNGGKSYATLVVNGELPETAEFRLCYNGQIYISPNQLKTNPGESSSEVLPIGFNSVSMENRLQIMPNPFKNELMIGVMTTSDDPVQISIFTIDGKLVKIFNLVGETGFRNIKWDAHDTNGQVCEQGLYIIQANLVDGVIIKRAMLVR